MAKLNVGIIGCGGIAAVMAKTVRKTRGFRPYAVASRSQEKAVGFAKLNGFKKAYGSYEDLVKDPKVDLVYVATPHSEHFANAKLCIENGKPCLVEKSFTANAKQAEELFRLANEKHVFITEAIWTRYMPFLSTMKEVLASGVIGEPVLLQANLGYAIKQNKRMTDPNLAGGSLLDVGVYTLNFADMMFGDDILRTESTCTYTSKHLDEQDSITLVYRDGRMAVLNASMLGITDRRGIVSGTKGYLEIENINNFEKLNVYDAAYKKIASYKRPRQITGYEYELQACARALENGWLECPEMKHAETLKILRWMDSIRESFGIVYPFELPQEKPDPLEQIPGATIQDPGLAAEKREEAEAAAAAEEETKQQIDAERIPTGQTEEASAVAETAETSAPAEKEETKLPEAAEEENPDALPGETDNQESEMAGELPGAESANPEQNADAEGSGQL